MARATVSDPFVKGKQVHAYSEDTARMFTAGSMANSLHSGEKTANSNLHAFSATITGQCGVIFNLHRNSSSAGALLL